MQRINLRILKGIFPGQLAPQRREAAGAVVFGVSPDKPAALAKWQDKIKLPYDLLSDVDHEVAEAYGAWGQKMFFGKTITGIIRSHFVIDAEGKFEDVQVKVKPEDSVSLAMAQLAG